jgi:apolipoprotein N-acyltransferase
MMVWVCSLWRVLAVLLSSFLLACSFPLPPGLETMEGPSAVWLGLIPLILVARTTRPKFAFWWGWLCGFLFWLVAVSWILRLQDSWGCLPMVLLAWVALAAYCALYMGLFAFLLSSVFSAKGASSVHPQVRRLTVVVLAPLIWVGCEYLRAVLGTGFPWNLLGASQYRNTAVIQIASWGGVYAVSGVIVLLNAAVAITALRIVEEIRSRSRRRRVHVELMLGLTVVALCWARGVSSVRRGEAEARTTHSIRIAAIQPNIPQIQKWSEDHRYGAYQSLREQTELAVMSRPALMIWPETAIPDLLRVDPMAQSVVASLVTDESWLLVGSMDFEQPNDDRVDYYNGSFLVNGGGRIMESYRKRHLVPFGEYLPFENQIPLIKELAPLGFSCMPGEDSSTLFELPHGGADAPEIAKFGVLICFEDVFPYLARRDVQAGAQFLVNQTNDGWFKNSSASRQHLVNAVFRAVENRTPLVRCANTGVTCFIDRFGRIAEMLVGDAGKTELRGFSVAELVPRPRAAAFTPYTRFGDWLFALPCAMLVVMLGIALVVGSVRRRKIIV